MAIQLIVVKIFQSWANWWLNRLSFQFFIYLFIFFTVTTRTSGLHFSFLFSTSTEWHTKSRIPINARMWPRHMHSIHNSIITVCPVRSYHLWVYCTNMSVCKTMPDSTWEKNVHFSWIIYQRSLLQEQSCEKYTPEKTLNKCRYVCLIKRKKKKKKRTGLD